MSDVSNGQASSDESSGYFDAASSSVLTNNMNQQVEAKEHILLATNVYEPMSALK